MPRQSKADQVAIEPEAGTRETLADKAAAQLRKGILDLSLEPGLRLDERVLDNRFGISRTPAREALNRLAAEGLIKLESNFGFFVLPLDLSEIKSFFDAYFVEEKAIACFCDFDDLNLAEDLIDINKRHAAAQRKVDPDAIQSTNTRFHLRIAEACHNDHLLDFSRQMQNHSQRLTYYIYRIERRMRLDLREEHRLIQHQHTEIVDAISARNRKQLDSAITEHAKQFHARVTRIISHSDGATFSLGV